MNIWLIYGIIALILVIGELIYFKIADKCNIIDKPNERSSHSTIVLRGGGIIFLIGTLIWAATALCGAFGDAHQIYPWFLLAVLLAAGISFIEDIHSLPDSVRLIVQFVAMGLLILQLFLSAKGDGLFNDCNLLVNIVFVIIALIVCVNELKMSHPLVSVIYMALQLAVSLGFIFICPLLATSCGLPLVAWHWIYLAVAFVLLVVAYVLFKKKYYHLHEEYLASLKK